MNRYDIMALEDIWDLYAEIIEAHMRKRPEHEWSCILRMGSYLSNYISENSDKTMHTVDYHDLIKEIRKEIEDEERR